MRLQRNLTCQLSGRPGAREYAPRVRSRSESARLRLMETGHGPLQRLLGRIRVFAFRRTHGDQQGMNASNDD
jgi:hypothetical protein